MSTLSATLEISARSCNTHSKNIGKKWISGCLNWAGSNPYSYCLGEEGLTSNSLSKNHKREAV